MSSTKATIRAIDDEDDMALTPGMYTWVTSWSLSREPEHIVVADRKYAIRHTPGETTCCLVLRTDEGWYVAGDLDTIEAQGLHTHDNPVPITVATPAVLDAHLPRWREIFQPGWTPDPQPRTVVDHLRAADRHSTRVTSLLAQHGYDSARLDPALRLAEFHQRQAQLRHDALRLLPAEHPQLLLEQDELTKYLASGSPDQLGR